MNEDNYKIEGWKYEIEKELDSLVSKNFDRLYNAVDINQYNHVWGEISKEMHDKYTEISLDVEEIKRQKKDYVSICINIYSEEEFPAELSNLRTYRFVKQFSKLPKQAPNEWNNFELEERVNENLQRQESYERVKAALSKFNKKRTA